MSSRFTVEMPTPKMTGERLALVSAGLLFMVGPFTAIYIALTTSNHPAIVALLVTSSVFGMACGAVVFWKEFRRMKCDQAEKFLKSALEQLRYTALEPIEVNGSKDRILIRDEYCSALWDVTMIRNKVICTKRV